MQHEYKQASKIESLNADDQVMTPIAISPLYVVELVNLIMFGVYH